MDGAASSVLQIPFDCLLVFGYVIAAWLFTALSAFQVVGGIDGPALRAGIVSPDFIQPSLIANSLDSFKIGPQFDPMGLFRLKPFQVIAGIAFTFAAKGDAPLGCASGQFASLAIGQSLLRPAPIASALFHR